MSHVDFNPYRQWLNVQGTGQSPDHYALLGLTIFEEDGERIETAFHQRYEQVRRFQVGLHEERALELLDELSQAYACLTKPEEKGRYDERLRAEISQRVTRADEPPADETLVTESDAAVDYGMDSPSALGLESLLGKEYEEYIKRPKQWDESIKGPPVPDMDEDDEDAEAERNFLAGVPTWVLGTGAAAASVAATVLIVAIVLRLGGADRETEVVADSSQGATSVDEPWQDDPLEDDPLETDPEPVIAVGVEESADTKSSRGSGGPPTEMEQAVAIEDEPPSKEAELDPATVAPDEYQPDRYQPDLAPAVGESGTREDAPLPEPRLVDRPSVELVGHPVVVASLGWSPSGGSLATCDATAEVRLWNLQTGASPLVLKHTAGPIRSFVWGPNGRYLLIRSAAGYASLLETSGGQEKKKFTYRPQECAAAWNADGSLLAVGQAEGIVFYRAPDWDHPVLTFQPPGMRIIWALAFNASGSRIAAAEQFDSGNGVRIWRLPDDPSQLGRGLEVTHTLPTNQYAQDLRWLPATGMAERLTVTTFAETLFWNLSDDGVDAKPQSVPLPIEVQRSRYRYGLARGRYGSAASVVSTSADGGQVAYAGAGGVAVIDAQANQAIATLPAVLTGWGFSFAPVGNRLAVAKSADEITIADVSDAAVPVVTVKTGSPVLGIQWSPDAKRLATYHQDFALRIWDVATAGSRRDEEPGAEPGPVKTQYILDVAAVLADAENQFRRRAWEKFHEKLRLLIQRPSLPKNDRDTLRGLRVEADRYAEELFRRAMKVRNQDRRKLITAEVRGMLQEVSRCDPDTEDPLGWGERARKLLTESDDLEP